MLRTVRSASLHLRTTIRHLTHAREFCVCTQWEARKIRTVRSASLHLHTTIRHLTHARDSCVCTCTVRGVHARYAGSGALISSKYLRFCGVACCYYFKRACAVRSMCVTLNGLLFLGRSPPGRSPFMFTAVNTALSESRH